MSRCTGWVVPGQGATLGTLRRWFNGKVDVVADDRPTSLALINDRIPDEQDRTRYLEVERRAASGEEL